MNGTYIPLKGCSNYVHRAFRTNALLYLIRCKVLAMTKIKDSVVYRHVCPVWSTTLCYTELANDIKLGRIRINTTYKATTLVIDEKLVVGRDD